MTSILLLAALQGAPIPLDHLLAITGVYRGGASAGVSIDAVQAILAEGKWKQPVIGDTLTNATGQVRKWQAAPPPDKDGWIQSRGLGSGYLHADYKSDRDEVLLLSMEGASMAYVNGEAVIGDVYEWNIVQKPVYIHAGVNEFLFASRGRLRPMLLRPSAPVLVGHDFTCPDLLPGDDGPALVGVQLINASNAPVRLQTLSVGDHLENVDITLPPLAIRKVGIKLPVVKGHPADATYRLKGAGVEVTFHVPFRERKKGETYKVTFRSEIDGSVQYYAVRPSLRPAKSNAFVLSLHGAGVEASGQADAYGSKTWAAIVCPTNRRPYGFDWEDWGRLDALEVLHHAQARIPHDPSRTVLTGHSMGGHGTWQIGTMFPDQFAAIGPSAGWVSYQSYRIPMNGETVLNAETDAQKSLDEASLGSDTVARVHNLAPLGVYILHGVDDDNVPIREARLMRDALKPFHHDFTLWEQPGVGHWWNNQQEPGASCVDWAPMFDLFARRRIPAPEEMRDLAFQTVAPNLSADCFWARIEQQIHPFQMSNIDLHVDPNLHRVTGTTGNVATLTLRLGEVFPDGQPVTLVLDGTTIANVKATDGAVTLRRDNAWTLSAPVPANEKNPSRGGGFKEALTHRFVIVYGTHGTADENTWMAHKAQFDAESWWYRGNGDVEVIQDDEYRPSHYHGRDVLLIGNSVNNRAWNTLLKDSPIQVTPQGIHLGNQAFDGEDKLALFCRPTAQGMVACVGVTGLPSMRLSERIPYLASGVGYPDYTVYDVNCLRQGTKGLLAGGWFDNHWNLGGQ